MYKKIILSIIVFILGISFFSKAQTNVSYNLNSIPIGGGFNTAFGFQSLPSVVTANKNTAVGHQSLFTVSQSSDNTAVGYRALYSSGNGGANVAVGSSAILNNGIGSGNVGIGTLALNSNTSGFFNTSLGTSSLTTNTTGWYNTTLGANANVSVNNLQNATAVGANSIATSSNSIQLGDLNVTQIFAGTGTTAKVIVGGLQITGGSIASGKVLTSDALGNATWQVIPGGGGGSGWGLMGNAGTVDGTNFIGTTDNVPFNIKVNNDKAGRIDHISLNTFFGRLAGNSITTGTKNIALGEISLYSTISGSSNTAIGYSSMFLNTTAGNNTGLGVNTSTTSTFVSDASAIGAGALVNTTSKIRLGNTSTTTVETQTSFTTVSDGRFKINVSEEDVKGIDFIKKLRPVVYNFDTRKYQEFLTKNMNSKDRSRYFENWDFAKSSSVRQTGFIAQEVEAAAKEAGYDFNGVHIPENADDNYSLSYSQFVIPLVKSVQELSKQNDELKEEIAELRSLIMNKRNIEGTITISESGAKLYQNAPNPFSHSTTIKYSLPATAKRASLVISSAMGVIVKEYQLSNKADQLVNISGGQLAAGTYTYSLFVNDKLADTKKMILTQR